MIRSLLFATAFIAGALTAIMPFVAWFAFNGALSDFWKDYIIANMIYTGNRASAMTIISCSIRVVLISCVEVYLLFLVVTAF